MLRAIIRRLLQALLSLGAVAVVMFLITNVVGDPVNAIAPPGTTIEQRNRIRHSLGIDRPLVERFLDYFSDLVRGDLGRSFVNRREVSELITQRLPATLQLGSAAVATTLAIGIPLGLIAGKHRYGTVDRAVRSFAVLGQSAPAFWVGTLLISLFAVRLGWLPPGGRGGATTFILPVVTMAWATLAGVTRLMRSSSLEVLGADYITFLRMQGISERRILWKHVLRNALLPVLTYGGLLAATIIVGSVVTESVYVWPGMGKLLLDAVNTRDYPVVQGVALVFAVVYVGVALVIDLLYVYINPKLRIPTTR